MECYTINQNKLQKGFFFDSKYQMKINAINTVYMTHKLKQDRELIPQTFDCPLHGSFEGRYDMYPIRDFKKCLQCGTEWTQWDYNDKEKLFIRKHPSHGYIINGYRLMYCNPLINFEVLSNSLSYHITLNKFLHQKTKDFNIVLWRINNSTNIKLNLEQCDYVLVGDYFINIDTNLIEVDLLFIAKYNTQIYVQNDQNIFCLHYQIDPLIKDNYNMIITKVEKNQKIQLFDYKKYCC